MLYLKLLLALLLTVSFLNSQEKEPVKLPKKYLNSQGMMMLYVKGGTYTMGTDKIYEYYEKFDIKDFRPAHQVTLSPFYMAKFEVTKGMFKAFAKETGTGDYLSSYPIIVSSNCA